MIYEANAERQKASTTTVANEPFAPPNQELMFLSSELSGKTQNHSSCSLQSIRTEVVLCSDSSWDGVKYKEYGSGQPEIAVVRIYIPAHTTMHWHSHPMPNVGYMLTGELTVESLRDGKTVRFTQGQALPEMVDTVHRGVTGELPATLVVFYASISGFPLSNITADSQPIFRIGEDCDEKRVRNC